MKLIQVFDEEGRPKMQGYLDLKDFQGAMPWRLDVIAPPERLLSPISLAAEYRMRERWDKTVTPSQPLTRVVPLGSGITYERRDEASGTVYRMNPPKQATVAVVSFPGEPERIALRSGDVGIWDLRPGASVNTRYRVNWDVNPPSAILQPEYADSVAAFTPAAGAECDLPAGMYLALVFVEFYAADVPLTVYSARSGEMSYRTGRAILNFTAESGCTFWGGFLSAIRVVETSSLYAAQSHGARPAGRRHVWLPLGLVVPRDLQPGEPVYKVTMTILGAGFFGSYWKLDESGNPVKVYGTWGRTEINASIKMTYLYNLTWREGTAL